jgi:SAM-dependent methyltransferase
MTNLAPISRLTQGADGIWVPLSGEGDWSVSFPSDGHAECLQIEENSFWFRHRNRCLVQTLSRFPPNGTVFELGAGNGFVASALESVGYPCVALEPAVEGARNARRRGVSTVVSATLEAAAFRSDSVPAIGIFDVIEHIQDSHQFLREVVRTLMPGGRVYATVPAFQWLWSEEDQTAGHFRRYTSRRLRQDFQNAGLSVDFVSYFFSALVLPVFLLRAVPRLFGWHAPAPLERAKAQHAPKAGRLTGILARALDLELTWLTRGHGLPFGSSCVIVATKPS